MGISWENAALTINSGSRDVMGMFEHGSHALQLYVVMKKYGKQ